MAGASWMAANYKGLQDCSSSIYRSQGSILQNRMEKLQIPWTRSLENEYVYCIFRCGGRPDLRVTFECQGPTVPPPEVRPSMLRWMETTVRAQGYGAWGHYSPRFIPTLLFSQLGSLAPLVPFFGPVGPFTLVNLVVQRTLGVFANIPGVRTVEFKLCSINPTHPSATQNLVVTWARRPKILAGEHVKWLK